MKVVDDVEVSDSYEPCHCGADCCLLGVHEGETCWGTVSAVDEQYTDDDHWWIHACKGHADPATYFGPYEKEPPPSSTE